nr:hypothetical protein [Tanacetum cinerariifolium]
QFRYLGVMVGENMARHKAWSNVTLKLRSCLSKWKTKTLSVGGRLTLLKSILGASPLFYMSIFKTPKAIYGVKINSHPVRYSSNWRSILREMNSLKVKGLNFMSFCSKRMGNRNSTNFWLDIWKGDSTFCELFPRVYALESVKDISVASKMAMQMDSSFRRLARGDRWVCNVAGNGNFSVKIIRDLIDDLILPSSVVSTRWVKSVPIKINIFMWRARRDCLPTRLNLSHRGVIMETVNCPTCGNCEETVNCPTCGFKDILEGVFYVMWWVIWKYRNQTLFGSSQRRMDMLFDEIVLLSFTWCSNRCKNNFDWISWMKYPRSLAL